MTPSFMDNVSHHLVDIVNVMDATEDDDLGIYDLKTNTVISPDEEGIRAAASSPFLFDVIRLRGGSGLRTGTLSARVIVNDIPELGSRIPEWRVLYHRETAYLAGPMRGMPLYNFPAFERAGNVLREALGFNIISPAEMGDDVGLNPNEHYNKALRSNFMAILEAGGVDHVFLLPGWRQSKGARAEALVATMAGIPCWDLETLERVEEEDAVPDWAAMAERVAVCPPPDGEVRVESKTGGMKGSKLARFDLMPGKAIWELAEHYGKGERKYPGDENGPNYKKGYPWHLSFSAAMRHLWEFWLGEERDAETGSKHVIAAAWHCLALAYFMDNHPAYDDRH